MTIDINDNLSSVLERAVVLIPAFNEEKNIAAIVKGIKCDFPGLDVVVVNDGSVDITKEIAESSGAIVLTHVNQMGYGVTLQTGYKYIEKNKKYDYFVQLDADGQHNYKDIPKLLISLVNKEADIIIASRFIGDFKYKFSFVKKLGILFFRSLVFMSTGKNIKDITSGYQAFNRQILQHHILDSFPCYYPDANILILLIKNGFNIKEVESKMLENSEGKSMHNGIFNQMYYVLNMTLSILTIIIKTYSKTYAK